VASTNGEAVSHERSVGSLYLELNADTTKLERKLRAISTHLAALADELDEIDADDAEDCQVVVAATVANAVRSPKHRRKRYEVEDFAPR